MLKEKEIKRALYFIDLEDVVKSITDSVTTLNIKTRKTLILRVLQFKDVGAM